MKLTAQDGLLAIVPKHRPGKAKTQEGTGIIYSKFLYYLSLQTHFLSNFCKGAIMAKFPDVEWLTALSLKLNTDERYAHAARNWEGDMIFQIDPGGAIESQVAFYLDLWHGKCRDAYMVDGTREVKAVFTLKAPYDNYVRLLKGELEPMQALLTRKIGVQGNMAVLMRSVPTVLDFVRCCREVTDSFV
jgi:putative sterol carrier protein